MNGGQEQREGSGRQGEQLNFEVRLVLLKPSEQEPLHLCSVETLHALGSGKGLDGSQRLCGRSRTPASWAGAGMWLSREKGSAQEQAVTRVRVEGIKRKDVGLGGTGREGLAPGCSPERRGLSLQTREELSPGSGCQSCQLGARRVTLMSLPLPCLRARGLGIGVSIPPAPAMTGNKPLLAKGILRAQDHTGAHVPDRPGTQVPRLPASTLSNYPQPWF